MKNFAITAIVALGVAAPALAQTQLEQSVGAEAGEYSLSQLARLKAVEGESGNDATVYFGNSDLDYSARGITNNVALEIFDRLAAENEGDN